MKNITKALRGIFNPCESEQCENPDNETLRLAVKLLVDWAGDYPTSSGWLGKFNYNGCEVRCSYDNATGAISITRTSLKHWRPKITKTNERLMPDLVWIDGKADVSEWFGEGITYEVRLSDNEKEWQWDIHEGTSFGYGGSGATEAKVKQAALEYFHARLSEPMGFGEAMKAVARGCEIYRPSQAEGIHYGLMRGVILMQVRPDAKPAPIFVTKDCMESTDWHFYFPSKPTDPERKYPTSIDPEWVETWYCPDCNYHNQVTREPDEAPVMKHKCSDCDCEMHRPRGTQ